jgi:hypothetical protein
VFIGRADLFCWRDLEGNARRGDRELERQVLGKWTHGNGVGYVSEERQARSGRQKDRKTGKCKEAVRSWIRGFTVGHKSQLGYDCMA